MNASDRSVKQKENRMARIDKTRRYEMPVIYGPSDIPDITIMKSFKSASLRFLTERDAVAAFLPEELRVPEFPVISVTWSGYREVDYLGGRGYNVVRVAAQVTYQSGNTLLNGTFPFVIWESDCNPIILGREISGYPKLFGRIPDLKEGPNDCSFECFEYETRLLLVELNDLQPVVGDELSKIRAQGRPSTIFCWKYIPGVGGTVDADYLVKATSNFDIAFAAQGQGRVDLLAPTWQQAPFGHRILNALKAFPILRYAPAIVTAGSVEFGRTLSERIT